MAHIVYEGVAARKEPGGSLFEGTTFFLTQQVPFRTTYIEKIEVSELRSLWTTGMTDSSSSKMEVRW
jgi:hypothetical protein